ncbi:MAG: double-strand break repair helicase AddA, partial [Alphaproteobacteria bacterium HGW-Alphaproteobacteria-16]
GLRIDTIHAFAQFLIGNFPDEAGLAPGTRVMDDRSRDLLARDVLTDLIDGAERAGDARLLDAITLFTTRKEPGALQKWLMRAADAHELWAGQGAWQSPMDARVRQTLGMPADAGADWANEPLHPDIFPDDHLLAMIPPLEAWGTATAAKCLSVMREWLELDWPDRISAAAGFRGTLLRADGMPSLTLKKPRETDPDFIDNQETIAAAIEEVEIRRALLATAEIVTAALEIGRAFALRWEARKAREGLLDFSDLIRKAADLLGNSAAADWIRYKLDRHFDHILIDEAQDTNQSQWDIVFALIDDFFSGEGARGDKLRTIFTVGDYKQAIFGFQGTSPENFARAKAKVEARIMQARDGIRASRINRREPGWQDLDLGRS